jgi:hypothetical protein
MADNKEARITVEILPGNHSVYARFPVSIWLEMVRGGAAC